MSATGYWRGHGETRDAYVQYEDGRDVRGADALRAIAELSARKAER